MQDADLKLGSPSAKKRPGQDPGGDERKAEAGNGRSPRGLNIAKAGQYTVGQWMNVWVENSPNSRCVTIVPSDTGATSTTTSDPDVEISH